MNETLISGKTKILWPTIEFKLLHDESFSHHYLMVPKFRSRIRVHPDNLLEIDKFFTVVIII